MGLPKISIVFKGKAETMMKRGERGTIALLLNEDIENIYEITSITNIPENLSEENKKYIKQAYQGGDTTPRKIYAVCNSDLDEGLQILETLHFQYGAVPGLGEEDTELVSLWTKDCIDKKDLTFQMILANCHADHEAIINFTTDDIILKNGDRPSTSEFTARIAGLLAGTPMSKSITYSSLNDIESVERIGKEEGDQRVDNGELILINDRDKIKVGRGVTSLKTIGQDKNSQWKKILIVQKMFMWKDDVKSTISDYYVGNFSNTYDYKCLLLTDIRLYNKALEKEGILDNSDISYNNVYINIERQADYLESIGELKEGMSEDDIKKANTRDKVFINTNLKFTDAMEDFEISATV